MSGGLGSSTRERPARLVAYIAWYASATHRHLATVTASMRPDRAAFLGEMKSVLPQMIIGLGEAVKDTLRYAARKGAVEEERGAFRPAAPQQFPKFTRRAVVAFRRLALFLRDH